MSDSTLDQTQVVEQEDDLHSGEPLKFDHLELKKIAAEHLQKHKCTSIRKIGEGTFNKVYLLTMDDGFECIGRVAFPNFRYYKTESEVATMEFLAAETSIRVPKVYAWDSNPSNPVGAEYIIMEKIPGVSLGSIWVNLTLDDKKHFVGKILDIMLLLFNTTFDKIGSLYRDSKTHSYEVGLIVCDLFFDGKRGDMDLDRGPWKSTGEYLGALIRSEAVYIKAQRDDKGSSKDDDDDYDEDDVDDILQACAEMEKIIPYFCPSDPALERFCLHHSDLHLYNVMVEGNEITGIIDWESTGAYPTWMCADYPEFLMGRNDVEASEADNWGNKEEFQEAVEDTILRRFFLAEVEKRDQSFARIMKESGKFKMFLTKTITLRDFPNHVKNWIKRLRNGSDNWDYDPFSVKNYTLIE
ncbi:Phosphotransferase enzyme [Mortierella sp. AM989]|nr:Phosphotransferase enzyme [Mortierella sp. AM989]